MSIKQNIEQAGLKANVCLNGISRKDVIVSEKVFERFLNFNRVQRVTISDSLS